jgi:hypothetical protein
MCVKASANNTERGVDRYDPTDMTQGRPREMPCPLSGGEMRTLSLERIKQGIHKVLTEGKRIWLPSLLTLVPLGPSTLVPQGLVREDKSIRYSAEAILLCYSARPIVHRKRVIHSDQGHERDQLGNIKRQKSRPVSRVPV